MNDSSSSALLRCLQQLDNDAIAEVLLPKLVKAGAAGHVARTCSFLRQLVQQNTR